VDSTDGTLARINPSTHAVVQTVPVGSQPSPVTATNGNAWVANGGDGTVSAVNMAANAWFRGYLPVAIVIGQPPALRREPSR
jgi:DNA-binding beta-propeller fold protein YncE